MKEQEELSSSKRSFLWDLVWTLMVCRIWKVLVNSLVGLISELVRSFLYNDLWVIQWLHIEATFLPKGSFDHSPMIIRFMESQKRKSGFKFCNHWAQKENFIDSIKSVWSQEVQWHKSFRIQTKLNRLKAVLRDKFHRVLVQQALEHSKGQLLRAHPCCILILWLLLMLMLRWGLLSVLNKLSRSILLICNK